jgi:alpha-L-rhamnosidase
MGLLEQDDWQAQWIGNPLVGGPRTPVPPPFFRKDFSIDGEIQSARLNITALGLYEAAVNGLRVGEDVFTPGWTDYNKRLQYQTYDVSQLLTTGQNTIGAVLGDGWYCGHTGWQDRQLYGDRPKLLAQLEITLADGSTQIIASDESWDTAVGPLLEADLIMGEAYDARLELPTWNIPSPPTPLPLGEGNGWSPVIIFSHPPGLTLVAQNTSTIRAHEELIPIGEPNIIWGWPEHDWVFDFGQNLVGRVRLKVKGARGRTITLRFGEALDESGRLYTENLRTARQTDYYTCKGDPNGEVYESRFTFHGFRYVQLSGLPEQPPREAMTAIVLHSDNPPTFEFECSDPLVNQLQHNIEWGWKGNSVDIPTDCPQRDERLGWTGDAQVFAKTATYITNAASFFTKWVQDLADAQLDSGAIPAIAPATSLFSEFDGGAAWSDAFIIIPWTIWQQYGDTRIIETHYQAMCRYMDYLAENSPGLIRLLPGESELSEPNEDWLIGGFGDWLAQDGSTDRFGSTLKALIGTAYLAYDAKLMSQIATTLDKPDEAAKFNQLFQDTRAAFIKRFISPDELVDGQTQTSLILALHFDLVPEELRPTIIASLVKDIEVDRQMHLATGFVGTPHISQVLTDIGRLDLAYALLLQKTFPSWLFPVINGATTIWERWDSWTPENGFQDASMNSFNHYAYGAIGAWMYENIAGIRTDPEAPGFKHIILQPRPSVGITHARGEFQSSYGHVKSQWQIEGDSLIWEVIVPPNTSATAYVPAKTRSQILEGAVPIEDAPGLEFIRQTSETVVYELQSGNYRFSVTR